MNLVKIKDSDYVRDLQSNAVLNVNKKEIEEFNSARKKILQEKREKEETKLRLSQLETDLGEIKQLLRDIINIRSGNAD